MPRGYSRGGGRGRDGEGRHGGGRGSRGDRDGRGGSRGGRGERGRRGGGRGRRVMSFLQPCLLVMLHRGKDHGYNLLNGLDEFGFDPGQKDPSLIYRALRDMEEIGLVTSEWDPESSQGPQRRVYQITQDGEDALAEWVSDLQQTRQEIDALIAAYGATQTNDEHKETE
jgi:PadR family transcriptional regulator PadR